MATTKKRINITLSPELERALTAISKRDKMPEATKAALLIESALLIEEDSVWEALALARDTKNAKFVSHEEAWK